MPWLEVLRVLGDGMHAECMGCHSGANPGVEGLEEKGGRCLKIRFPRNFLEILLLCYYSFLG